MIRATALALIFMPLAACAPKPVADAAATSSADAQHPARIGMANPASQHCVAVGGRLEIRNESAGQVGYCHLPDGRVVEEWALFRAAQGSAPQQ